MALLLVASFGSGCREQRAEATMFGDTVEVARGSDDTTRFVVPTAAREMVIRAREFDRSNTLDSAAALYSEGAERLPLVSDWLHLRAAGVIGDSAQRARLYARIRTAVARDRIAMTEALARERTGDIAGAIRAFAAADAPVSAFRLRLARAPHGPVRDTVRRQMIAFVTANAGSEAARDAIGLFDESFPTRTAQEELALARAAAASGRGARAVAGFAVAARAGLGGARDRFTYATMLARVGRHADAAAQYARVSAPSSFAAAAQYQLARMRIATGNVSGARATLRSITSEWPGDTSAASALMLLADLATDDDRDQDARAALLEVGRRFPQSRHAPAAAFRAGLIAYVHGQHARSAAELADAATRYPSADDANAARYWSGRAHFAGGRRAAADSAWRSVLARAPASYYAVLAARRLNTDLPIGDATTPDPAPWRELDSALARVGMLEILGMGAEAKHEYDRLFRDAAENRGRMLLLSEALAGTEQAARAITLGWRVIDELGRSPRTYRVVYPVVERERIIAESRANRLDPVLVASLIRQESNFNPRATSPAGARGLMQIMPSVGQQLAARKGISGYTPEMLYDPGTSLALGTLHLRNLMADYPNIERALAAYNAGGSRVRRWAAKRGADDPEVFTERIPFVETRGYVRAIVRNRAFYQALYPW